MATYLKYFRLGGLVSLVLYFIVTLFSNGYHAIESALLIIAACSFAVPLFYTAGRLLRRYTGLN